jgi:uncharacterized membrane protein
MAYPAFVYFSLDIAPPFLLVAAGLGLIALRLCGMLRAPKGKLPHPWIVAFLLAAGIFAAMSAIEPQMAVKTYPVLINFCVAALFGMSLIWPPTVVERIARIAEPELSLEGQRYTRKVTQVWTLFLFANTVISAITVLYGSEEQWALWNGLISYLLMGLLFAGEYALRQVVRRRA